jgi:D-alanyl-D-alanine carboxypeptidase/D-alanyl-D-alanine-endopeptidase (penicillin-binding protein 4)
MLRRSVCLLILVVLLHWPSQTEEAIAFLADLRRPEFVGTVALDDYLVGLERRGVNLEDQGIRVESLDGTLIFADHLGDRTFNPASVIKVATTLAALERFGPDHRFETAFSMAGTIDDGVLNGDLILSTDGDPEMGTAELRLLAREVVRAGIRKVNGSFIVSGPFTVGNLHRRDQVARYLVRTMRQGGVRVPDDVSYGPTAGFEIVRRQSSPLLAIVFEQNAHSVNTTADRLGEAIGGPAALERYLIDEVGMAPESIRIEHTSGLRINRVTATGTVLMLRKLARWLDDRGLRPEDILPVAGMDSGTTRLRFNSARYRGAVVAKTGTLVSTDDGVSALAGILYTADRGPVLFAIMNTRGPVIQYRRYQDDFVEDLIEEFGGPADSNARTHRERAAS